MEKLEMIWLCTKIGVGITVIGSTIYWTILYKKLLKVMLVDQGEA